MIFIHSLKNRYQSYVIIKLRLKGIRLFNQGEIYDAISVFLNAINICKPDDGIHFSDDQKDQLLLVIQVMGDALVTKEAQIHAGIRCNYSFYWLFIIKKLDEFSKYEEALIACENAIRIGEDDKTSILRYKKYLLYKVGRTNEADSIVIHKPIHIYSGYGRFIG